MAHFCIAVEIHRNFTIKNCILVRIFESFAFYILSFSISNLFFVKYSRSSIVCHSFPYFHLIDNQVFNIILP